MGAYRHSAPCPAGPLLGLLLLASLLSGCAGYQKWAGQYNRKYSVSYADGEGRELSGGVEFYPIPPAHEK